MAHSTRTWRRTLRSPLILSALCVQLGCIYVSEDPDNSADGSSESGELSEGEAGDSDDGSADGQDDGMEPDLPPGTFEDGPGVYPAQPHIIAIGDVHGDLFAAADILIATGVVDEDGHWAAGTSWVVQVGDQLDRGYQEEAILNLFEDLRVEAAAAGGRFIAMNGNHEIMQVEADFRYVFDEEAFGGLENRELVFSPGNEWALVLAKRNVIVKVGRVVFVHGGALPHHAVLGIENMNAEQKAWMKGEVGEPDFVDGSGSLVWDRTYSDDDPDEIVPERCEILDEVLEILDADMIVVAHTVQDHVNETCDGKAWRIDSGIAAYYGGTLEAIEITDDIVSVIVAG